MTADHKPRPLDAEREADIRARVAAVNAAWPAVPPGDTTALLSAHDYWRALAEREDRLLAAVAEWRAAITDEARKPLGLATLEFLANYHVDLRAEMVRLHAANASEHERGVRAAAAWHLAERDSLHRIPFTTGSAEGDRIVRLASMHEACAKDLLSLLPPAPEAKTDAPPPYEHDGCHADRDDDCAWKDCPQLRDGEPVKSGRHCPLDRRTLDDE